MSKTKVSIRFSADQLELAKFPDSVPILAAGNCCKFSYSKGNKLCLSARMSHVFANGGSQEIVSKVMLAVMKDEVKKTPRLKGTHCGNIVGFNDAENTTVEDNARVWNRTMAACGYVEDNPAARTIEAIPALA